MNKTIQRTIFVVLLLAVFLNFAGCANPENNHKAVNIAFVVGIVDDETKFNEGIAELTMLPANPGTDYAFISIEGEPSIIGDTGTIPDFDHGYTDVMMERVRAEMMADLIGSLTSYEPTSPEIDIAGATELAVRFLHAHAAEDKENILGLLNNH